MAMEKNGELLLSLLLVVCWGDLLTSGLQVHLLLMDTPRKSRERIWLLFGLWRSVVATGIAWLRNVQELHPPSFSGFLLAGDCGCGGWLDMAIEKTFQLSYVSFRWCHSLTAGRTVGLGEA